MAEVINAVLFVVAFVVVYVVATAFVEDLLERMNNENSK